VIRRIRSRWSAMAASKAAGKALGSTLSQAGTPENGPFQGARRRAVDGGLGMAGSLMSQA